MHPADAYEHKHATQGTCIYVQTPHKESYKNPPPTDVAQTHQTHPPETDTCHPS